MDNTSTIRRRLRVLSPLVTVGLGLFILISLLNADPIALDRSERIGAQVRCPACEGESIAESPSSYAADMMIYVRELVDQGLSDQQVIDRLMASYPDSQLLDPPLRAGTVLLWLIPAAVLLSGAGLVLSRLRSRTRSLPGDNRRG